MRKLEVNKLPQKFFFFTHLWKAIYCRLFLLPSTFYALPNLKWVVQFAKIFTSVKIDSLKILRCIVLTPPPWCFSNRQNLNILGPTPTPFWCGSTIKLHLFILLIHSEYTHTLYISNKKKTDFFFLVQCPFCIKIIYFPNLTHCIKGGSPLHLWSISFTSCQLYSKPLPHTYSPLPQAPPPTHTHFLTKKNDLKKKCYVSLLLPEPQYVVL